MSMMNNDKRNIDETSDQFLKELFNDFELETPSTDMKQQIMSNALQHWSLNPETSSTFNWASFKYWIIAGVLLFIGSAYFIDSSSLLSSINLKEYLPDLSFVTQIEESLYVMFVSFASFTSLFIITLIGGILLLLADKTFKKYFNSQQESY